MKFNNSFKQKLFQLDDSEFDSLALEIFRYQAKENQVYSEYIQNLGIQVDNVKSIYQIPFLPINFFKSHEVTTSHATVEAIFESSGTTGANTSRHLISDLNFYKNISKSIFESFYGSVEDYHFFALLPSYLERNNSSLIFMVDHLIKLSDSNLGGFYLDNHQELYDKIKLALREGKRKVMLIGVSFALLDFIEGFEVDLSGHVVMETGGMKGRRKEVVREELHQLLSRGFNFSTIHSEYGMTELQSQAYSLGKGLFKCGHTMKVLLRDIYDPFNLDPGQKDGGINVIDLANIDTCSFIETMDVGRNKTPYFEILGRFDNSDIRGCNLMI